MAKRTGIAEFGGRQLVSNNDTKALPLISVIIGTYNRQDFIVEAVQSLKYKEIVKKI
jgi:hypothetical protein